MHAVEDIDTLVAIIAAHLDQLSVVVTAHDIAAATLELDRLAHTLRLLDLLLRTRLMDGNAAPNHDEIVAYLASAKLEILQHMKRLGMTSREKAPGSKD